MIHPLELALIVVVTLILLRKQIKFFLKKV